MPKVVANQSQMTAILDPKHNNDNNKNLAKCWNSFASHLVGQAVPLAGAEAELAARVA
jgi:hypothetical protein